MMAFAKMPRMRCAPCLLGLLLAGGCATVPSDYAGYEDARGDSLEGVNRTIYSFNDAVDDAVLKPVAKGYRGVVPAPARQGVTNAFDNIDEPLTFVNALLQGKVKAAFRAVDRFVINSTYGALGTTDRAAELGLERQEEDFGQTLAVWGVGSGPFLMLPVLGPSSLRDLAGFGVDNLSNPWGHFQSGELGLSTVEELGLQAGQVIDLRANLIDTADPVLDNALDPYATMKSAYFQSRLEQIRDGEMVAGDDGSAFEEMEEFEGFDFPEAEEDDALTDPLSPQPEVPPLDDPPVDDPPPEADGTTMPETLQQER